jgi:hypothetical protein
MRLANYRFERSVSARVNLFLFHSQGEGADCGRLLACSAGSRYDFGVKDLVVSPGARLVFGGYFLPGNRGTGRVAELLTLNAVYFGSTVGFRDPPSFMYNFSEPES